MAQNLSLFIFLVLIVLSTEATGHHEDEKPKEIKVTGYYHVFTGGPNATTFVVAGIRGRPRNFNTFGTVFVGDVPLTKGISPDSPEIGRAQGIGAVASLNGANTYASYSIIFTSGKYNGSTLEVQGINVQPYSMNVRELSIVSGTEKFRFSQGYAQFKTVFIGPSQNYTVVRVDITVRIESFDY